ncbi:uncharacterized protein LOC133284811 [Gastrolobium bilobum]|uniref:uncharacterized protein LOC133284811 n=1 Tax=Gastrolobium bilobum TaxID=150636 RepID=UPI002AB2266B|nr:uncharacterized protein LOC133284811 [Gastrolobium bilobum]
MGRVYTLDQHVADRAAELLKGTINICGEELSVLFDPGATNSFIADYVANAFNLTMSPMQSPMQVTSATGEVTASQFICRNVEFRYKGKKYNQDFIFLPLAKLNLILGMDWLAKQRVVIDCRSQSIIVGGPTPQYFTGRIKRLYFHANSRLGKCKRDAADEHSRGQRIRGCIS